VAPGASHGGVDVGEEEIFFELIDEYDGKPYTTAVTLPIWAKAFIEQVDRRAKDTPITVAEAREALDLIEYAPADWPVAA